MVTQASMRAGFGGGLVVDYPNSTKAKKYFLVLMSGGPSAAAQMPAALGSEQGHAGNSRGVANESKRDRMKKMRSGKASKGSREWIREKKERRRRKGLDVRPDSKFTGRKRSGRMY